MAYVEFNNNPVGRRTGDCVVRAVSKALNMGWEATHLMLDINAISMAALQASQVAQTAEIISKLPTGTTTGA